MKLGCLRPLRCLASPSGILGQHRVREEGVPFLGTAVRGYHKGPTEATLVDELIDILRVLETELLNSEVVQS